jgi:copper chaperone
MATELIMIGGQAQEAGGSCGCGGCGCGGAEAEAAPRQQADADSVVAEYTVVGMTCGHCVASVSEEVGAIEGVTAVEVDLASGRVTVTSTEPVQRAAVEAAVDEAGYRLAA